MHTNKFIYSFIDFHTKKKKKNTIQFKSSYSQQVKE